jgi:hypothetical protein
VTSTMPAEPSGEVAEHRMVVEQLTAVAAAVPNLAVVVRAPEMKPVPAMATWVPAASGPDEPNEDVTEVIAGTAS